LTRCSEGSDALIFFAGFQVRQEAKESHRERFGCASQLPPLFSRVDLCIGRTYRCFY
jgi:hypothetical protein